MEKGKILVAEDHKPIRDELCDFLSKYGYEAIPLTNYETIIEDCIKEQADLILLDINLPVLDGYYICREIRSQSDIPIIVVTSRDSEMDELMSMNLGADDFITKPYNTQILMARIASILRRSKKTETQNVIFCKDMKVCLNDSTAEYHGNKIELTKNEIRILYTLIKHQGSIVSRDELMEMLWQSNEFVDDNTLTVNVNRLRKRMDSIGWKNKIQTKRGQGYMI